MKFHRTFFHRTQNPRATHLQIPSWKSWQGKHLRTYVLYFYSYNFFAGLKVLYIKKQKSLIKIQDLVLYCHSKRKCFNAY